MTGHRVRTPALEGDADLARMLRPVGRLDGTALAPVVAAGHMALGWLSPSTDQAARVTAGLSVHAGLTTRVEALVAWSELAADIDAADPDAEGASKYWADRDAVHQVLVGLTPGLDDETRTAQGDLLAEAARELADLERHRLAGTTPKYPQAPGCPEIPADLAMQADVLSRLHDQRLAAAHLAAHWDGGAR